MTAVINRWKQLLHFTTSQQRNTIIYTQCKYYVLLRVNACGVRTRAHHHQPNESNGPKMKWKSARTRISLHHHLHPVQCSLFAAWCNSSWKLVPFFSSTATATIADPSDTITTNKNQIERSVRSHRIIIMNESTAATTVFALFKYLFTLGFFVRRPFCLAVFVVSGASAAADAQHTRSTRRWICDESLKFNQRISLRSVRPLPILCVAAEPANESPFRRRPISLFSTFSGALVIIS